MRHDAVVSLPDVKQTTQAERSSKNVKSLLPRNQRPSAKRKLNCFESIKKHHLADCDQSKVLPDHLKQQTDLDTGRC